ncbi:TPA: hypothetical protein H2X16_004304 [Salmonella enterica]|nr:hypothetical protein [Salmonella enterica subsp. enterica serovar Bredeney]HAK8485157.1 hypothetical protein [Salmonella enterica]HAK8655329.1 hypothetical protein [Salmonella enterica]
MDTNMNDGYDLTRLSVLLALSGPDVGLHAGGVNTISFHILAELSGVRNPRMVEGA